MVECHAKPTLALFGLRNAYRRRTGKPPRNQVNKHTMRKRIATASTAAAACLFGFGSDSLGQVLFEDNFDSGFSDVNWTVNQGGGTDSSAFFAFNYADIGIPSAPHSTGGSTIGLRFLVNQEAGVFQGISASPTGQSFTGDFRIRFDLWMNFVGPLDVGGNGTTQMASFGWGTSGTTAQWAAAKHSMMFAGSGDGQTAQDYRAYLAEYAPAAGAPIDPSTGFYLAGTATDARNNTNAYYASLGGKTAPSAQLQMFPGQVGTTSVGTLGFAWRDMLIEKIGNTVSWSVDGLPIASVPITNLEALGGENIFFGMFDINAGSSNDPNDFLNAAIFDNIQVEVIPEPASACFLAVAVVGLCARRRRPRS